MIAGRWIPVLAVAVVLLSFVTTGAPGQEMGDPHRPPHGPISLGAGVGRFHFLSALPASYLNGISGRTVDRGHSLDDRRARGVRLALRLAPKWWVEGERVFVDTEFGLANLRADVDYWGINALYALPGAFYATAGAGTVSYSFETPRAATFPTDNTDVTVNVGVGAWMRSILGGPFTFRTELKVYNSWFDVPGLETRAQQHLGGISGLEVAFP